MALVIRWPGPFGLPMSACTARTLMPWDFSRSEASLAVISDEESEVKPMTSEAPFPARLWQIAAPIPESLRSKFTDHGHEAEPQRTSRASCDNC